MLSTLKTRGGGRVHRNKERARRLIATLAAGLVLALGMPLAATTVAAPAQADTGNTNAAVLGQGARPFYVYVKAGEYLYVKTDQKTDYIRDNEGKDHAWEPIGNTFGPAKSDGIWQVYLATGNPANPVGSWDIEPRTSTSASSGVQGRVWTNQYYIRQNDGVNATKVNLNYWMMNDTGYLYQVEMRGFRGMNSTIAANSVGNKKSATNCSSAYRSVDTWSGLESTLDCGDRYRIFFSKPAADLPATAKAGNRTMYVAPQPLTKEELNQSELTYDPSAASQGNFAGTFTSKITERFQGNYKLQIDTDGNDSFTDAKDVTIDLAADGSGTYKYVWDGKDQDGKLVPSSGKKMNARILFDKVGEMHIVQRDVEGRDGIRVTLRNGDRENVGDTTLSWDDRALSTKNRESVTPNRDGRAGVDSSGFVHGWEYSYSCHEVDEDCGAWGNNRAIEDWVSQKVSAFAEVQAFGGDPSIAIEKTADRTSYKAAGEVVTYNFHVTNTGNLDLENVAVNETEFSGAGQMSAVTCPTTTLLAGAAMDCTATYTVQQEDLERGTITNAAISTGNPPGEEPVTSPPDDVEIPATDLPAISLLKEISNQQAESVEWGPASQFQVDQSLDYRFTVTNTGNLTLNDVTVSETVFTGSGDLTDVVCPVTTLAPGESTICTATYTPTSQADVDQGTIDNTAIATGNAVRNEGVTSDPSSAIAVAPHTPALHLVKLADKQNYVAGDLITYSFQVSNVGNVTMKDIVVNETEFTGSGELSPVVCPVTELAPGANTICTATYTATQEDLDRGTIENAATSTGTPPDGPDVTTPPSEVEIPGVQEPHLTLVKTADQESYVAGDLINYSFEVTNSGNVTMKNISVEELAFSGDGELSAVTCPADVVLAPRESTICTASYTTTQADLDRGTIENAAIAHGTDPKEAPVDSNDDDVNVPGAQNPKLVLDKSVDKQTFTEGTELTYSFTVTNTGNATTYNVGVVEVAFNGTGKLGDVVCPAEEVQALAPGASVTCTATYTATLEDRGNLDLLRNVAVATGNPGDPGNPPLQSNEDDAVTTPEPFPEVPAPAAPAAPLAVTGGDGPSPALVGGGALLLIAAAGVFTFAALQRRRQAAAASEAGDATLVS
ncbi:DUF7507 domain-containing protein [Leucobacter chromiiresistens]|uniref:Conserved repeat domain-containing protein n=1 Tax=Leucobacter chromiiresistens TaxID=1079994 RepID=A0A1H0YJL6_9MICO|nr:CARDB domain-containing protein [Leucobacter chromiiresistens]SDQ15384.1 conserved repeat domain-containing protein [Leucobacter chromiiresistens]